MLLRRTAAFENLGVPSQPSDRNSPLVTMLKKKGKRVLENAGEVVAHLEAVFPWARFNTLDGEAVATMSIREQVRPPRVGKCLCPYSHGCCGEAWSVWVPACTCTLG